MLRRTVTSHLTSPVQKHCLGIRSWGTSRGCGTVRFRSFLCCRQISPQPRQIPPPLQAHPVCPSLETCTTAEGWDTVEEEKCFDNTPSDLGRPRPKSDLSTRLSARSLAWENTASGYRRTSTNKVWKPTLADLNKLQVQARPKKAAQKNSAKLSGQYISPRPEPRRSPSLHVKHGMGLMQLHKKSTKANEKLHLQHRDGRIPCRKASNTGSCAASGFGKRASVLLCPAALAGSTPGETSIKLWKSTIQTS